MKTYEEMAQSALSRIRQEEAVRKRRRRLLGRGAATLCLAALVGFGAWRAGVFRGPSGPDAPEVTRMPVPNPNGKTEWAEVPADITQQPILRPGDEGYIAPVPTPDPGTAENAPEATPVPTPSPNAPEATPAPTPVPPTPGVTAAPVPEPVPTPAPNVPDNGQKGTEPAPDGGYAWLLWNGLTVGGTLRHALEETPDGVLEILATFRPTAMSVTDFFYEDRTLADWAHDAFEPGAPEEAMAAYKRALDAYVEAVLAQAQTRLTENGIPCSRAAWQYSSLTISVSAQTLKSLPLDGLQSWRFELVPSGGLKTAAPETDAVALQPAP